MAFALHEEEKEVVQTTLWFANIKRITSTDQIEKRFKHLKLVIDDMKTICSYEVEAYRDDQGELRDYLSEIISSHKGRKRVAEEVTKRMKQVGVAHFVFKNEKLDYQFSLNGIQAVCALGLALILDKNRKLTTRLQQCGNAKCRRFNLDFKPKGRPRRFCNDECKCLHDNQTAKERVKRHRAKYK